MISIADFINQRIKQYGEPTILDIGCGTGTMTKEYKKVVTVDAYEKFNPVILMNLEHQDLPSDWKFEIVLMIDFIEHLTKSRGYQVLEQAKHICTKELIIFTPIKWDENHIKDTLSPYYGNPFNLHRSFWNVKDFPEFKRYRTQKQWYYTGVWSLR